MKKILLSILLLGVVIVSGCVSGVGNKAQNSAAGGGINAQPAASGNNNVKNADGDYTAVTLEDWDWDFDKAIIDPNGNIVYRRLDAIYSRNLQTNEERVLVNKEDNIVVNYDHYWIYNNDQIISYSHDGTKFAYLTPMLEQKRHKGNWTVSVKNTNDKSTKKIYEFNCWSTKIVRWGPDDTKLSITCANYDNNVKSTLWIIDANTGKELFKKVVYVKKNSDYWSPDGKKVAYVDGEDNHLYYWDAESRTIKKLLDETVFAVAGWTKNGEIIFNVINQAGGRLDFLFDVASNEKTEIPDTRYGYYFIISHDRTKVAYAGITSNTNVVSGGTSFVRIYNFLDKTTKTVLEKSGSYSDLLIPSSITWSDSDKKIAFIISKSDSDESPELNVYDTEDGSLKKINYAAKEGSIKPMWYKDKLYIVHFAPRETTEFVSGDTDYGTVTATFNGKPATVRYTDMKVGQTAEISVTVTSKIDNAGVYIKLEGPRIKNAYNLLDGPSKIGDYLDENEVTAGWSKTYTWRISSKGNVTDIYAPIDIDVQFRNHHEDDERKVSFTIANPYIVK